MPIMLPSTKVAVVAQGAAGCNIQLEKHVLSCFGTKDFCFFQALAAYIYTE